MQVPQVVQSVPAQVERFVLQLQRQFVRQQQPRPIVQPQQPQTVMFAVQTLDLLASQKQVFRFVMAAPRHLMAILAVHAQRGSIVT